MVAFAPMRAVNGSDDVRRDDAAYIVVHHKNFPRVLETLACLVADGVRRDRILLIDNSEDADAGRRLEESVHPDTGVIFTKNAGYAAAVNHGLRICRERWDESLFAVGVLTHDVHFAPGTLDQLRAGLSASPTIGAVGPVLWDEHGVWSAGGALTRALGIPYHVRNVPAVASPCDWLDGAFNLYRWEALRDHFLDEAYFLYFEEVDFHLHLKRRGYEVVCVPDAGANQHSSGIPPRLHGRNLPMFLEKQGHQATVALAIAWEGAKMAARVAIGRKEPRALIEYSAGVLDYCRDRLTRPSGWKR